MVERNSKTCGSQVMEGIVCHVQKLWLHSVDSKESVKAPQLDLHIIQITLAGVWRMEVGAEKPVIEAL